MYGYPEGKAIAERTMEFGSSTVECLDWKARNVFITGASGFLGSYLVRDLVQAKANVICLVRDFVPKSMLFDLGLQKSVTIVHGDILNGETLGRVLNEYDVETVFHLAAQTQVSTANIGPASTLDVNIRGTWNLLEACRRYGRVKQIVIASSDKAYGDQPELPYSESTNLHGNYAYDVSKSCADLIGQMYRSSYDLPIVITRCANFFGGGDLNYKRIIPGTIRAVLWGKAPVIRSDGKYIRDYLYIEDGATAYRLLAEQMHSRPEIIGQAFNFSYGLRLTVLQVVEKILLLMRSSALPEIQNQATNEIREQYLDSQKAKELLGWSPSCSFDEALGKTIHWYRQHA